MKAKSFGALAAVGVGLYMAGQHPHMLSHARAELTTSAHHLGRHHRHAVVPSGGGNEQLAMRMAARAGWGAGQRRCLALLWTRESAGTWSPTVVDPLSGAYGIPQALPAGKMASAGADWRTNPRTQIRWGLSYIAGRYGSPCSAWAHETSIGWY